MFKRALFAISIAFFLAQPASAQTAQNQPDQKMIKGAQDVPLVVHQWGNRQGIPVILIHGFGFGANAFKYQIGPITKDLHLIAPDLRGHGLSAKPWTQGAYNSSEVWADDLKAVMDAFSIEKPILVGWSFGGYVVMNYLRHYGSESVSGVILTGSLAGLTDRPPPPDTADAKLPPLKGNSRIDNYHEVFDNYDWLARVMTYEPPTAQLREQKMMTLAMMPPHVKRAMIGMPLDNRDLAASIAAPILFISGDKDGSIPADYVAKALQVLPNAQAIQYEGGVGHSPFEERIQRFNKDLLNFAKRHGK